MDRGDAPTIDVNNLRCIADGQEVGLSIFWNEDSGNQFDLGEAAIRFELFNSFVTNKILEYLVN